MRRLPSSVHGTSPTVRIGKLRDPPTQLHYVLPSPIPIYDRSSSIGHSGIQKPVISWLSWRQQRDFRKAACMEAQRNEYCKPKGADDIVYVLTFRMDKRHHERMTELRRKYFPDPRNRLDAHLTLFHALPQSHLEDTIIPGLKDMAKKTTRFSLRAYPPYRLQQGIAIGIPRNVGGNDVRDIHAALQRRFDGFLSKQDSGRLIPHYTVMNKVMDEQKIEASLKELQGDFRGSNGTVNGLTLWRYNHGGWVHEQDFEFQDPEAEASKHT